MTSLCLYKTEQLVHTPPNRFTYDILALVMFRSVPLTHSGPGSGAPAPNNSPRFRPVKTRRPHWPILDVGGGVFGLETFR